LKVSSPVTPQSPFLQDFLRSQTAQTGKLSKTDIPALSFIPFTQKGHVMNPSTFDFRIGVFLLIGLMIALSGCDINTDPGIPSIEKRVVIPLYYETFTADSVAAQSDYLQVNSDQCDLELTYSDTLDSRRLESELTIGTISETVAVEVGWIELEDPGVAASDAIELQDFFPEAANLDEQEATIPDIGTVDPLSVEIAAFSTFQEIEIETAEATVTLDNNLVIPLTDVSIYLYNSDESTPVTFAEIDEILPGESQSTPIDLNGKRLSNQLRAEIGFSSPGSNGEIVLIDAESSFNIDMAIHQLSVRSATARIPSQTFEDTTRVTWSEPNRVISAGISSGRLRLEIENDLPLAADEILLVFDNFKQNGQPLEVPATLEPSGSSIVTVDMSGYELLSLDGEGVIEQIQAQVYVQTEASDGFQTIYATDQIQANIQLQNFSFDYFRGILAPSEVDLGEVATGSIFGDEVSGLDFVHLTELQTYLNVEYNCEEPHEGRLFIDLTGLVIESVKYETGETREFYIGTVDYIECGMNRLDVSGTGEWETFGDFFNNLPDSIIVSGYARIGDGESEVYVADDDELRISVDIESPLVMVLPDEEDVNVIKVRSTPEEIEMEQRVIDAIGRGDILTVIGTAYIINGFPGGALPTLYFGKTPDAVFDENAPAEERLVLLGQEEDMLRVGQLNPDGTVAEPSESVIQLDLTPEQIDFFNSKFIYAGATVRVFAQNDNPVRFTCEDVVDIYFNLDLEINLNDEWRDEGNE